MKIAMVASEVLPISKSGGLADYAYSLSNALCDAGHEVEVITPDYGKVMDSADRIKLGDMEFGLSRKSIGKWNATLIQNAELFERPSMYGYEDDQRRFGLFSKAAAEYVARKKFDVAHCNDWQTGYIPLLLKIEGSQTPTVYTIHNLEFQGNSDPSLLSELGIGSEYFQIEGVEYYGRASAMKAGIVYSDRLVTVSPTYSREIQTPEFGFGMEGVIRKYSGKLKGIVNGIDYRMWDPAADTHLSAHYSAADLSGKASCKSSLQREFSLPQTRAPLLTAIGRLWRQKGMDILLNALEDIRGRYQLIVLGTGDEDLMKKFTDIASVSPNVRAIMRYDEALAHRMYAGGDLFIMPSRFEPCGLGQMISMRYGNVPVVRKTGGLADTVAPFNERTGNGDGFVFEGDDPAQLAAAINHGLELFQHQPTWKRLMLNCMLKDFSWGASAREYQELYAEIPQRIVT